MLRAIKNYMLLFPGLQDETLLLSDHAAGSQIQYNIIQLPGDRVLSEDLAGNQDCQYPFAFQSIQSTLDELERFDNVDFYDQLTDWFKEQTKAEHFPEVNTNQIPERIETLNWAYLMQEATNIGVYQIQCRFLYTETT